MDKKILNDHYNNLKEFLSSHPGKGVIDWLKVHLNHTDSKTQQDVEEISAAAALFREIYQNLDPEETESIQALLKAVAKDMDEGQRKGLYLQLYDMLREGHAGAQPGYQLVQDYPKEEELLRIVSEQLELEAQTLAEALFDPQQNTFADAAGEAPDPLLAAAAVYTAGEEGDLDGEPIAPAVIGFCDEAGRSLALAMNDPKGTDKRDEILRIVIAILVILLIVAALAAVIHALAPGVAAAGAAAAQTSAGSLSGASPSFGSSFGANLVEQHLQAQGVGLSQPLPGVFRDFASFTPASSSVTPAAFSLPAPVSVTETIGHAMKTIFPFAAAGISAGAAAAVFAKIKGSRVLQSHSVLHAQASAAKAGSEAAAEEAAAKDKARKAAT